MTHKKQAQELFDMYADEFNFDDTYSSYRIQSKKCAIIVVNQIIKALGRLNVEILHTDYGANLTEINGEIRTNYESHVIWWNEVINEINKI